MNNIEKEKQLLEGSHHIVNVGPFQIQKRVIHILLTILHHRNLTAFKKAFPLLQLLH